MYTELDTIAGWAKSAGARAFRALPLLVLALPVAAQPPSDAPPRPQPKYQVEITRDVMVPMRDGVRLATDVYRPVGVGERLPTVLMRTPYNKVSYRGTYLPGELFAGQGYVAIVQDVRGQYGSEGRYEVEKD